MPAAGVFWGAPGNNPPPRTSAPGPVDLKQEPPGHLLSEMGLNPQEGEAEPVESWLRCVPAGTAGLATHPAPRTGAEACKQVGDGAQQPAHTWGADKERQTKARRQLCPRVHVKPRGTGEGLPAVCSWQPQPRAAWRGTFGALAWSPQPGCYHNWVSNQYVVSGRSLPLRLSRSPTPALSTARGLWDGLPIPRRELLSRRCCPFTCPKQPTPTPRPGCGPSCLLHFIETFLKKKFFFLFFL